MAKEAPTDKASRPSEKKSHKEKRSSKDGVHKSSKPKKDKKPLAATSPSEPTIASTLLDTVSAGKPSSPATAQENTSATAAAKPKSAPLIGALVPFANPLADEKVGKKVLKSVKKAAKNKSLKRGVKEVVKSLRKSAPATASAAGAPPPGVVVLAADISPMDVISHIPVLCEDHGVPYIFVPSRAELGAAGSTKRPTSVVMVGLEKAGKKGVVGEKGEGEEEFAEVYADLVKVVAKASRDVRV
ncbi:snoRNA-binding protein [Xylographa trunciseda]|nr:snoRNA-binding protein [Xylographa trunciseda]